MTGFGPATTATAAAESSVAPATLKLSLPLHPLHIRRFREMLCRGYVSSPFQNYMHSTLWLEFFDSSVLLRNLRSVERGSSFTHASSSSSPLFQQWRRQRCRFGLRVRLDLRRSSPPSDSWRSLRPSECPFSYRSDEMRQFTLPRRQDLPTTNYYYDLLPTMSNISVRIRARCHP